MRRSLDASDPGLLTRIAQMIAYQGPNDENQGESLLARLQRRKAMPTNQPNTAGEIGLTISRSRFRQLIHDYEPLASELIPSTTQLRFRGRMHS